MKEIVDKPSLEVLVDQASLNKFYDRLQEDPWLLQSVCTHLEVPDLDALRFKLHYKIPSFNHNLVEQQIEPFCANKLLFYHDPIKAYRCNRHIKSLPYYANPAPPPKRWIPFQKKIRRMARLLFSPGFFQTSSVVRDQVRNTALYHSIDVANDVCNQLGLPYHGINVDKSIAY